MIDITPDERREVREDTDADAAYNLLWIGVWTRKYSTNKKFKNTCHKHFISSEHLGKLGSFARAAQLVLIPQC